MHPSESMSLNRHHDQMIAVPAHPSPALPLNIMLERHSIPLLPCFRMFWTRVRKKTVADLHWPSIARARFIY